MDNPSALVRRASKRDLDALVEICLAWPGAPASRDPAHLKALLEQALSDDDATMYLASNLELLGFAHVTYQARPVRLGWRATIEELHVLHDLEPGQIETALLEAIVEECRERGDVIALYLLTQPDLEPRQFNFYAQLGFRERGRDVLVWQGSLQPR